MPYRYLLIFLFVFSFQTPVPAHAGEPADSIPKHSPRRATLYSAVIPGLGQMYNRKYWKVPVLYTGFAISGYFWVENNRRFQRYQDALVARLDDDPATVDEIYGSDPRYTDEYIKDLRDYYRKNRDLSLVVFSLIYALNIIDANVDAHLWNFDISDNLSFCPALIPDDQKFLLHPGLSINYRF